MITYDNEGGGGGQNMPKLTGITSSMTSPYEWSSATNANQDYAIDAFVTPSKYIIFNIIFKMADEKYKIKFCTLTTTLIQLLPGVFPKCYTVQSKHNN